MAILEAAPASIGGGEAERIEYAPGGKCDYVCVKNRLPMAAITL